MAFDTYMDIDGVEGEATATGFEKKIEIFSFSWGASNPSTVGPGSGGRSSGRVALTDFSVMKATDKASAKLFQHCCTGEHIKAITISICKATGTGKQQAFLIYKFSDCMISSVQWSGSGGGDDTPTESLSFGYAKVEIEYKMQDAKGTLATAGQAAWDQTKLSA